MRFRSSNNTRSKMKWPPLLLCLFILFGFCLYSTPRAFSEEREQDGWRILVIYSTENNTMDDNTRILDLLLGHFAPNHIAFKSDDAVSDEDIRGVTHLVYYGNVSKELPHKAAQLVNEFQGPVLALGNNVGQLGSKFSFLIMHPDTVINKVSKLSTETNEPIYDLLEVNYPIKHVELVRGEAIFNGWKGAYASPLFSIYHNNAYYASSNLYSPFDLYLGEAMYSFFGKNLNDGRRLAYIRLEDVHPMSDPALLKETGDYLADRGIPFMIALIPTYTNPETRQQYHLKDMPKIVEVLKYLQGRGANILLHGYTHQYRSSETGEGFEFWDVLNNTPIWGPSDKETKTLKRHEFASKEQYDHYIDELNQFETIYIETRLVNGIQELTEAGLFPLGFEAPHYVMSQRGYGIVAKYFNFVLGQVQISDEDWEHMSTAPYVTSPSFLHGMTMLPETIGYYDNESPTPEADLEHNINQMLFVQNGVLGMFYHPYLGVEKLKAFISHVEAVPGLQWMDLRNMNASVQAPLVKITTTESGELKVQNDLPQSEDKPVLQVVQNMGTVQIILWIVASIVLLMVLTFILYTLSIRMNLRKQLFEERNVSG